MKIEQSLPKFQYGKGGLMKKVKPFGELSFSDAFLFAAAMEDAEICRGVLERILEFPVKEVVVHAEHVLTVNPEFRGIRMDVYADDERGTVYDVEMQTTNKGNLPKRSRYYQGQLDVFDLTPGDDFNKLRNCYIIFICTFDPFERGFYRYDFEMRCQCSGTLLNDGGHRIFLNTRGTRRQDTSEELIRFLEFVEGSGVLNVESAAMDPMLLKLQRKISEIKRNRRMEERYMLFGEMLQDERENGKADLLSLLEKMRAEGRNLDELILRFREEPDFLDKMMEQYHIEN